MRKPIVFIGPSLPVEVARTICDADYRPPVRRGDVIAAARERPPVIGMIDGVFMHTLAPSPHEVMRALKLGVPMMGSSSLGALRAVELGPFGMRGIGQVYEWFQTKVLDADDEVALVFHGERLNAISEPMVNVRYAVAAAKNAGVLTDAQAQSVIAIGKSMYFPERSYRTILSAARSQGALDDASLRAFESFLQQGDYDLKALDARKLLQEVARLCAAPDAE